MELLCSAYTFLYLHLAAEQEKWCTENSRLMPATNVMLHNLDLRHCFVSLLGQSGPHLYGTCFLLHISFRTSLLWLPCSTSVFVFFILVLIVTKASKYNQVVCSSLSPVDSQWYSRVNVDICVGGDWTMSRWGNKQSSDQVFISASRGPIPEVMGRQRYTIISGHQQSPWWKLSSVWCWGRPLQNLYQV